MAERYSLRGELQHAWQKFWGLSWKWKGPALAVAVLVLMGAIGAAMEDEPDGDVPPASASDETAGAPSSEPSATLSPTPKATATPTPTPTPRPSPTATNTPAPPEWITGLDVIDVTGNLENRGFECKGPTKLQTLSSWDCTNRTGEINVSVLGRDATHVRTIDATVFFFTGTPSDESAAAFLGFLATVPYDDATPAEARAWVETNIANGAETVFGSAKSVVYGPPAARSLQIVAVGAK